MKQDGSILFISPNTCNGVEIILHIAVWPSTKETGKVVPEKFDVLSVEVLP